MGVALGKIIRQKVKEDGRTAKKICEELGMSRGNLDKIYNKESLNSDLLAKFCLVLGYDFFMHVNPFRSGEVSGYEHPDHQTNSEDRIYPYHTPYEKVERCMRELAEATRELDFLEQSLRDLKGSLHDKDEIISLYKEKIVNLQTDLKACQEEK